MKQNVNVAEGTNYRKAWQWRRQEIGSRDTCPPKDFQAAWQRVEPGRARSLFEEAGKVIKNVDRKSFYIWTNFSNFDNLSRKYCHFLKICLTFNQIFPKY